MAYPTDVLSQIFFNAYSCEKPNVILIQVLLGPRNFDLGKVCDLSKTKKLNKMPTPTLQIQSTRFLHSAPRVFFQKLFESFSLLISEKVTIPKHLSVFSKKFNHYLNAYFKAVPTVSMVKYESDHKPFITVRIVLLWSQRPPEDQTHQVSHQKEFQ